MGPNIKKPLKVFLKTRVVICPGLMLLSRVVNVLQSSDQEQNCVYIKNGKNKQTRLTENTCRNIKTLQKFCFCNFISSLRKTVNDSVLMEGQMEPLPSQNNFVHGYWSPFRYPRTLVDQYFLDWKERSCFFGVCFFLIINTNTHTILCKEESTLALNP